jgi:ABC-type transport system substrate-binding protein
MKRSLLIVLSVLALVGLILTGCGEETTTTTTTQTTTTTRTTTTPTGTLPTTTQTTTTQTTTPPPSGVVTGGVLKAIVTGGPAMMSYRGRMGPADATYTFPAAEYLVEPELKDDGTRGWTPFLCESYNIDPTAKTFTFNLRKGVKFHDGTEMTAEVVKWNFQQDIDNGWLQEADKITSIETPDNYTVVIHFTVYSNQYEFNWGWTTIFSKSAWEANAGDDKSTISEGGISWAVDHVVGTGPFILQEYKRDVSMTFVKNPNYWQAGKPYLDAIEFMIIPEATTASALLQAGDVDMWYQGSAAQDWDELSNLGFNVQNFWPGLPMAIYPNTVATDSKWQDKRLREALEYALDKATIAAALGRGFYRPLSQLAPETEWGYIPDLDVREYNMEKAKQLIAETGLPTPVPVTLLVMNNPANVDGGEAIKQYLDAAGFDVTLDLADPGRYYGSVFGTGWADLAFMFYGMNNTNLEMYYSWLSVDPKSYLRSMMRTDYQVQQDAVASLIFDKAEQAAATAALLRNVYEAATVIPCYLPPATVVGAPYLHHDTYKHGFIRQDWENVWMEKH